MSLMLCQTLHAWFAVSLRVFLRAMCARRIHAGLAVHVVFMVEDVFKSDVFHACAVSAQCLLRYRDP